VGSEDDSSTGVFMVLCLKQFTAVPERKLWGDTRKFLYSASYPGRAHTQATATGDIIKFAMVVVGPRGVEGPSLIGSAIFDK